MIQLQLVTVESCIDDKYTNTAVEVQMNFQMISLKVQISSVSKMVSVNFQKSIVISP